MIFRPLQTIRVDLQRQLRGLLPRARQAFVSMWAPIPLNLVLAFGVAAADVPAAVAGAPAVAVTAPVAVAVCGAVTEIPSTCSIDSNRLLNKLCVVAGSCVEPLAAPSLTACPPFLWPWGIKLSVGDAAVAAAVEIKDMLFPH